MAACSVLRVRLDLREIQNDCSLNPSLIWMSVDTSVIRNIFDLKVLIAKKVKLGKEEFHLYCQECYMPNEETILIIRDEDLIRIHFGSHYIKEFLYKNENCTCCNNHYEEKCNKCHKKRKKHGSESNESDQLLLDDKSKKRKIRSETPPDIDNENREQEGRKKKHKHKSKSKEKTPLSDFASLNEDNSNVYEIHELNSANNFDVNKHQSSPLNSKPFKTSTPQAVQNKELQHEITTDRNIKEKHHHKHHKNKKSRNEENLYHNEIVLNSTNKYNEKHIRISKSETLFEVDRSKGVDLSKRSKLKLNSNKILDDNNKNDATHSLIKEKKVQQERVDKVNGNLCKKKRRHRRGRKKNNQLVNIVHDEQAVLISPVTDFMKDIMKNSQPITCTPKMFPSDSQNKHIRFSESPNSMKSDAIIIDISSENTKSPITAQMQTSKPRIPTISSTMFKNIFANETVKIKNENGEINEDDDIRNSLFNFGKQPSAMNNQKLLNSMNEIQGEEKSAEDSNDPDSETKTKKSYQNYPLLRGPPRIGDKIAYKILELSSTYCPEVSDYKEGKIIDYNEEKDDFVIELCMPEKSREKGKFDLPDSGSDADVTNGRLENNVIRVNWTDMKEPRLLTS